MKKTVFAIIAFACLSAFASEVPVFCEEYLKFEDASSNNSVIENVYCKGNPDYLEWQNEVPISYYTEQLRTKIPGWNAADSTYVYGKMTFSGLVKADTLKFPCDSAMTAELWRTRGYEGVYSIDPFLCFSNQGTTALYMTSAVETFYNAAEYPNDMVYPIWAPEESDLNGVVFVQCDDEYCGGSSIEREFLDSYSNSVYTTRPTIMIHGLQFVTRDDSLYLCALDSVLYRNGVCVNMDEIRAEAPDSRIVEPEWWKTALKIDQPLVFANPIELRLRGNSLGIVSPEQGELSLSDVQGRILHSTVVEKGQRWIPLSDYPAGMIVVRLVTRSRVLRGIVSWNGK